MSADKRSVSTDALETLGFVIDENQHRDAIHLAVEPVIAGQELYPGEHVGLLPDGTANRKMPHLGIVDPFLKDGVKKGQRFWLVVYPRQITSLRHVWSHPSFAEPADANAAVSTKPAPVEDSKKVSETWLRNFIASANCPDYDTTMQAIQGFFTSDDPYGGGGYIDGEYLHFNGNDAHGEIPAEFWTHAENVLDVKLPYRPEYFSCSC